MAEDAYDLRYVDPRAALAAAERIIQEARAAERPHQFAHGYVAAAAARINLSLLEDAEADLGVALSITADHPSDATSGRTRALIGMIATRRADYSAAFRHFAEALSHAGTTGDRRDESDVLHLIGITYMELAQFGESLQTLERAQRIKEELGDYRGLALCLAGIGTVVAELGDRVRAGLLFEQCIDMAKRSGALLVESLGWANLGYTHHDKGARDLALECFATSLAISRRLGLPHHEAIALHMHGDIHLAHGAAGEALEHYREAASIHEAAGAWDLHTRSMIGASRALYQLGDTATGIATLDEALLEARDRGSERLLILAHRAMAEMHEALGNPQQALSHYKAYQQGRERVRQTTAELGSRHREEVARLTQVQQETELQLLKSQMEPHFLLNTLHNLAALVRLRPHEATAMLTRIGDLLRMMLRQSSARRVTLAEEASFVTAYLEIEQVRSGQGFSFSVDITPEAAAVEVPHMLLQPLAENSVRHGFAGLSIPGELQIWARLVSEDTLHLIVQDNGRGLPLGFTPSWYGVGLGNTVDRLQRLFGPEHRFNIGRASGQGTYVEVSLPANVRRTADSV